MDDLKLLKEYATRNSQEAFATLVQRHIGMVYSAALRQLRDPHLAEEISQVVFIILAKKSGELRENTILSGWLYRTTRFACADALKKLQRRQRREQEVYMQSTVENPDNDSAWQEIEPHLDDALTQLGETDRNALVLRFFENRNLREVGLGLGVSEVAAQKRIARALEKLRALLIKRETVLPVSVLIATLSANAAQAAPAGLAATVATTAAVKGVAAGAFTLTLIKGTLKIMAWTKMKSAAVIGVSVLLVAGTTTVVLKEMKSQKIDAFLSNLHLSDLEKAPTCLIIRKTQFPEFPARPPSGNFQSYGFGKSQGDKLAGRHMPLKYMVETAYGFQATRTIADQNSTTNLFDFLVTVPKHPRENFQKEIQRQLGYVGRLETIKTNVFLLKVGNSGTTKLKISTLPKRVSSSPNDASIYFPHQTLSNLTGWLQDSFGKPVVDQTGLTNHYDISLRCEWHPTDRELNRGVLKQALFDQLGLELVASIEPIEMLIIERVRN